MGCERPLIQTVFRVFTRRLHDVVQSSANGPQLLESGEDSQRRREHQRQRPALRRADGLKDRVTRSKPYLFTVS